MRIFFDTEFIDDGKAIELISIGMVREDGTVGYFESGECDLKRACPWVTQNVVPHLTGRKSTRETIAREIVAFAGFQPEFWGYFADYDWVVMCQLFGRMMDLPKHWPMFCMDIQQVRIEKGIGALPKQESIAHNALNDAIWTRDVFNWMKNQTA